VLDRVSNRCCISPRRSIRCASTSSFPLCPGCSQQNTQPSICSSAAAHSLCALPSAVSLAACSSAATLAALVPPGHPAGRTLFERWTTDEILDAAAEVWYDVATPLFSLVGACSLNSSPDYAERRDSVVVALAELNAVPCDLFELPGCITSYSLGMHALRQLRKLAMDLRTVSR